MKTRKHLLPLMSVLLAATVMTSCQQMLQKLTSKAMEMTENFEKEDTTKWGPVVERDLDVPAFTAIDAKGAVRIVYTQDTLPSLRLRGNERCLSDYQFEVRKGTLKLQPKDFSGSVNGKTASVTLLVSAPVLTKVEVSGAGRLDMSSPVVLAESLSVEMEGAAQVNVTDLTVPALTLEIEGAGKCTIDRVSSEGDIDIEMDGAADLKAHVLCQELSVELNGAGNAVLSGECKHLNCEENGAAKVDSSALSIKP